MSDTETPSSEIEIADLLRRTPGLVRAAAKMLDAPDDAPADTTLALAGGFEPDRALVAAAVSLIARFAAYAGFDSKDLDTMADEIDRKAGRQPWRRS